MAFLKAHLRRKSSERSRRESLGMSVMRRKSESSSSRTESVPITERHNAIDAEVERLFQQATDTNRDHASSGHGNLNTDSSLFHKLMNRKDSSSKSTGKKAGVRRSFSQRVRSKAPIEPKSVDETTTRGSSPDFASDTGYDSDAAFIASPRFSGQSWDSIHRSSPIPLERTMTSLNQVLANEMNSAPVPKENNEATVLPSTCPQPNALSISKRRKKIGHTIDKNSRSYSRWVPSIHLSNDCDKMKDTTITKNVLIASRFTEMFDHPGLQDEAQPHEPRKVSIGWMSNGRRRGYGYSFVDKDENNTSCATDGPATNPPEAEDRESIRDQDSASNASFTTALPADDLSEIEETGSSTDATLVYDDQDADLLCQPNVEVPSEVEEKAEKDLRQFIATNPSEPELVSSLYRRHQWTLFPSYTRAERNKSTDPNYTVIVRDFCTKASPEMPEQEESNEEGRHHLIAGAIRQGFHNTCLWVIGLGKREIARYHAGFQFRAARSHENADPTFEMTIPFWDHIPKEELGDYHIEAWRATKRRPKKRSRKLKRFRVSVIHTVDAAARKARRKSKSSSSSLSSLSQRFRESIRCDLENGTRYVGRRHSAKF